MVWQCFTAILLGLVALTAAQTDPQEEYSRGDYPNPMVDLYECGRYGKKSHICDPNGILSQREADQLDSQIGRLENGTKCPCSRFVCQDQDVRLGYRVGVALLNKISDDREVSNEDNQARINWSLEKAMLFAYTLEQNWDMGECQEDVVILYSKEDNVVYTMTGDVARLKLRSSLIGDITMKARGEFGPNTYKGLQMMISDFRDVFENNYKIQPRSAPQVGALISQDSGASGVGVTLSILLSCMLAAILN